MATGGPAPGCARDRGRGDADVPPHRASAAPHAEPHTHRGAAQPTERPRGRRADPGWDIGHMWGARGTACGTRAAPGAAPSPAGSGGAHPAQPRTTPCFWPLSAAGGSAAVCPMGAALPAPLQGSMCSAALGNPGGGEEGGHKCAEPEPAAGPPHSAAGPEPPAAQGLGGGGRVWGVSADLQSRGGHPQCSRLPRTPPNDPQGSLGGAAAPPRPEAAPGSRATPCPPRGYPGGRAEGGGGPESTPDP